MWSSLSNEQKNAHFRIIIKTVLKGQQPRKLVCSYVCVDTSKRSFKRSCYLRSCQLPVISFPCKLVSRKRLGVSASGKAVSGIARLRSLPSSNRLPLVCGHLDALVELCLPCWETRTSLLEALLETAAVLCLLHYSLMQRKQPRCSFYVREPFRSTLLCVLLFPFVFSPKRVRVSCAPQLSGSSWRDKIVAITFPSLAFAWNWGFERKMWQCGQQTVSVRHGACLSSLPHKLMAFGQVGQWLSEIAFQKRSTSPQILSGLLWSC